MNLGNRYEDGQFGAYGREVELTSLLKRHSNKRPL